LENYEKYHSTLPNEDLVRIAFFERRRIKKEARVSAKKVLAQRNLTLKELDALKNLIRRRKREERNMKLKDKNANYGIFDYIVDLILGG